MAEGDGDPLLNDKLTVARPVLERSKALQPQDLVAIATAHSQPHLLAMSSRERIYSTVTDVLVRCGNRSVLVRVTQNPGAAFSDLGFTVLGNKVHEAPELKEALIARPDTPKKIVDSVVAVTVDPGAQDIVEFALPGDPELVEDAVVIEAAAEPAGIDNEKATELAPEPEEDPDAAPEPSETSQPIPAFEPLGETGDAEMELPKANGNGVTIPDFELDDQEALEVKR
jgi:hypothetical protein